MFYIAMCTGTQRVLKHTLFALVLFALPILVHAQTGTIAGTVLDAESGETIIGANVRLAGTSTGSTTDLEGRYEIRNVQPGTYTVAFSYIGFTAKMVTGVEVQAGQTTRIDITLAVETLGLDEVVVEARALRNNEATLLRDRQKSAAVSDAISSEAMSRAGSSTAADAVERVTGASVVGGEYVYVRGLGDRYMTTQLNGAAIPSSDPDRNAVSFDLFPAAMLDNIVTVKTFTPDRPGSFTGGLVDVGTRDFPDGLTFTFSSSVGVNTETTGRAFLMGTPGGRDWIGFDDGKRGIPVAWKQPAAAETFPNPILARRDGELAGKLHELATAFSAEMSPTTIEGPMDRSMSVLLGNRVRLFGRPLGFVISGSYDRDFSSYANGIVAFSTLTGKVSETETLSLQQRFSDSASEASVLVGGLGTLAYQLHPNHTLAATVMYNHNASSSGRYLAGAVPRDFSPDVTFESRALSYTERDIQTVQLKGKHAFPALSGLRAEWLTSRADTRQNEPDQRFFANIYQAFDGPAGRDTTYGIPGGNTTPPTRFFRKLDEGGWDSKLDLTLPVAMLRGQVKVGGAFNSRARTFTTRRFYYQVDLSRAPYSGDPTRFFGAQTGLIDTAGTPENPRYVFGNIVLDGTSPRDNYTGDQSVYAGYAMLETRLFTRLRVIGGARYENADIDVVSRDSTIGGARLRNGDWLPALSLVYEMGRANLRAAYGRTLARPTLRELAPFTSYGFINSPTLTGNPALKRTLVHNLDLRYEWFVRPGEIAAISVFYKRFIDPIERTILNNNLETRFENVDNADVYGIELEARKRLDDVWQPLQHFEIGANLTLTQSKVDIPADEWEQVLAFDPDADRSRPLQGQSPYVANADVTYSRGATTATLLYNVFGPRVSEVTLGGTPNIYEQAFHSLDLTLGQRIWRNVRARAAARNLLGSEMRFTQQYKGEVYDAERYLQGRSFSLSLNYSL